MIIDIHAHTSIHPMVGLHTPDASLDMIETYAKQHGVKKVFVLATYFPFKKSGVPNKAMLDRIAGHTLFSLIGSLDASLQNIEDGIHELEELAQSGLIIGIKLYAGYQDFYVSDPRIFGVYELAKKYKLPVMIHGGELHHCCSQRRRAVKDYKCGLPYCAIDQNKDLPRPHLFERAFKEFYDVKFVVSHLANPHFEELRKTMSRCANVYTDISGQFVSGTSEDTIEYRSLIATELQKFLCLPFGDDRILFGSDFPIQSYKDSIEIVNMLRVKESVREKILWRNANLVFGLGFESGGVR